MSIIIERQPRPEAAYWPPRRLLAATDAVAWPFAAIDALLRISGSTGVLGATGAAILVLLALHRLRTAIWFNGRYRFTGWVVPKRLGSLTLLGLTLKLFLHWPMPIL